MKHLFFIILFIIPSLTIAQTLNPYDTSISSHVEYLSKNYVLEKGCIYVQESNKPNLLTLKSIKEFNIVILNSENIVKKAKKKSFVISVIQHVRFENDTFIIDIVDFFVKYKRGGLNYVNVGGESFTFKYDCEKEEFVLVKNK
ncbi:hypothetical protein ACE193_23175 [Bernardetia sp. OM2101]|uniref:hypothetical protein n=1 Tax=Bernardetia sp. OM2101 TaxID=3344876 RepID=UPI0035D1296D